MNATCDGEPRKAKDLAIARQQCLEASYYILAIDCHGGSHSDSVW